MVMIGQQLKELREARALSQSEVANQLHISRQTISKWELDKSLPDVANLQQLAVIYQVSLDELLAVAEERKKMLQQMVSTELVTNLSQQILPTHTLTEPEQALREEFILREVVQPLSQMLGPGSQIYWVGIEKRVSALSGISVPAVSETSQTYLRLFAQDCSQFYFLTDNGIVSLDSIQFFEERKSVFYSFKEIGYLCLGGYAEVMKNDGSNPSCLGIFMTDRRYTLAPISAQAGRAFASVMNELDFSGIFYHEITTVSLLEFQKKWRRKQQLPI